MNVTYGQGAFVRDHLRLEGTIILSEHKILIVSDGEELSATFIPLEKIEKIRLSGARMQVDVRPAIMSRFRAFYEGNKKNIVDLTHEIVRRRGLKKRFLQNEWYEVPA